MAKNSKFTPGEQFVTSANLSPADRDALRSSAARILGALEAAMYHVSLRRPQAELEVQSVFSEADIANAQHTPVTSTVRWAEGANPNPSAGFDQAEQSATPNSATAAATPFSTTAIHAETPASIQAIEQPMPAAASAGDMVSLSNRNPQMEASAGFVQTNHAASQPPTVTIESAQAAVDEAYKAA